MQQRHAWWAFLAVIGVASLVTPLVPAPSSEVLFLAIGAAAVAAMVVGVQRNRPERQRAWWLLTIGLGGFVLGDLVFFLEGLGNDGIPAVFPSWADVVYTFGALMLFVGGLELVRRPGLLGIRDASIDTAIITLGMGMVVWLLVLEPLLGAPHYSALERAVAASYPLGDLARLGTLTLLILSRDRRHNPALWLLAGAGLLLLLSDLFYARLAPTAAYDVGGWIDVGWLLAYGMFGAAALHPEMKRLHVTDIGGTGPTVLQRGRMVALGVSAAIAPLCFALLAVQEDGAGKLARDAAVIAVLSAILIGLLTWRVASTTHRLSDALIASDVAAQRERVVAAASTRLGRAQDVDGVTSAVCMLSQLFDEPGIAVTLVERSDRAAPPDGLRVPLHDDGRIGAVHLHGVSELSPDLRGAVELVAREAGLALDRHRLAAELRRNEERFRSLVQHAPDAITVQDGEGRILYASPAMGRILGCEAKSLVGTQLQDLVHPDDVSVGATRSRGGRPDAPVTLERRLRHSDGNYRWVESRLTDRRSDPSVGGIVANHRDVSERRALEAQLTYQAEHDALTGLPNRRRFRAAVDQALAAEGSPAILYLDLDRFKIVNDRFGHQVGDELLRLVASRISGCLRPDDISARLGGDEFAVLLRDADDDQAATIAARLLHALEQPFRLRAGDVTLSASIGITDLRDEGLDAEGALGRADLAMYEAKHGGRARAVVYEARHHARTLRDLDLEAALRVAVDQQELTVAYQPILDLSTGVCVGAEALLRWSHETYGPIPPEEFIPIAERTGLIGPLGLWVLEESCRRAVTWSQPDRLFHMNVNISAKQLMVTGFAEEVAAVLRRTGHEPTALTLEITESTVVDDSPGTREALVSLRELGIKLAIDDFGTGYATLRTLEDVPADVLKIDRSFVAGVTAGVEDSAIVLAVLQLARSFGLQTVAEGVETAQQFRALRRLGCDRAQGYRFAAPLPAEELVPWVRFTDAGGELLDTPRLPDEREDRPRAPRSREERPRAPHAREEATEL